MEFFQSIFSSLEKIVRQRGKNDKTNMYQKILAVVSETFFTTRCTIGFQQFFAGFRWLDGVKRSEGDCYNATSARTNALILNELTVCGTRRLNAV
jgi:hypothetical protein